MEVVGRQVRAASSRPVRGVFVLMFCPNIKIMAFRCAVGDQDMKLFENGSIKVLDGIHDTFSIFRFFLLLYFFFLDICFLARAEVIDEFLFPRTEEQKKATKNQEPGTRNREAA